MAVNLKHKTMQKPDPPYRVYYDSDGEQKESHNTVEECLKALSEDSQSSNRDPHAAAGPDGEWIYNPEDDGNFIEWLFDQGYEWRPS